ncbi:MAG TPA: hypothetical protein VFP54_02915 [Acidimicrobiales bacterium]|nr:hypothetical protein [Acidimicrobiales bacterium]
MRRDLVEYARSVANADIQGTLDWLLAQGCVPLAGRGGQNESFGDLSVILGLPSGAKINIDRDRGQWFCSVAAGSQQDLVPLNALITAMSGHPPVVETSEFLPQQLPERVLWRQAVPDVITWLESEDRRSAVAAALDSWRRAMKDRLGDERS